MHPSAVFRLVILLSILPAVQCSLISWLFSIVTQGSAELTGLVDIFKPWNTLLNLVCLMRFGILAFAQGPENYLFSLYGEESEMKLAQAGTYVGTEDIGEYVSFTTTVSPYFLSDKIVKTGIMPLGVTDGMCTILTAFQQRYQSDPSTTGYDESFDVVYLSKHFIPLLHGKVKLTHVFYPEGFLEYFFGTILSTEVTQYFVCDDILQDRCSEYLEEGSQDSCSNVLRELPVAGESLRVDGDTLGCRVLHAVFADTNPEQHCAHVSIPDIKDPAGKSRCQTSSDMEVSDLFNPGDLDYFSNFAEKHGFDPSIGYAVADAE